MNEIDLLRALAGRHGLELREPAPGHVQILGAGMLVNWYPGSKRRTAYVAGAQSGKPYCSAEHVIKLALGKAGDVAEKRASRNGGRMKRKRRRMHATDPRCHWCRVEIEIEAATVDHLLPLSRGGSNRDDNLVLACGPCNQARRDSLPTERPRNHGDRNA